MPNERHFHAARVTQSRMLRKHCSMQADTYAAHPRRARDAKRKDILLRALRLIETRGLKQRHRVRQNFNKT